MLYYSVTVVLNNEKIKRYSKRITKIESFTNKDNWQGINYPSEKNYWVKIVKNDLTIAPDVLYATNGKHITNTF